MLLPPLPLRSLPEGLCLRLDTGPLTPWVESLTSGHLLSPRNRLPTSAVFGADTLTLKQGLLTAAQPQGH